MFLFSNAGAYLNDAYRKLCQRSAFRLYRSRQAPQVEELLRAFSWLQLPLLEEDWKTTVGTVRFDSYAIEKGVEPTEHSIHNECVKTEQHIERTGTRITVINTINNKALGDACLDRFKASGWTSVDEVRTFLTITPYHRVVLLKKITARTVHLEDQNDQPNVVNSTMEYMLFSNRVDTPVWLRLSAAMLNDMNPLIDTDVTRGLISGLGAGDADKYAQVFEEACEKVYGSVRDKVFNEIAESLDTHARTAILHDANENVARTKRVVEDRLDNYMAALRSLQQYKDILLGAQARADNVGLTEFIKTCKDNITYITVADGKLFIVYRTPLLYWDENTFNILYNADNNNRVNNPGRDDLKYMIQKVFKDKTHTLWMEEGFYIYLNNADTKVRYIARNSITCISREDTVPMYSGIENPHHKEFDCWGDNVSQIKRAILESDFPRALAQIFAAIAGINFSDSTVINRFFERTLDEPGRTQRKCIQDKETKQFMTIQGLYERRNEYETNETNEQTSERNNSGDTAATEEW